MLSVCVGASHGGAAPATEPSGAVASLPATVPAELPPWSRGELDIYHINTGGGNAAFFIFPDGTTMLFDAGDFDHAGAVARSRPLVIAPRRPSDQTTPGAAIAAFIGKVMPRGAAPRIDYAVISHFHDDHYGAVRPGLARSASGDYLLTGITEVGERVPIGTLIDRAYPDYAERMDARQMASPTFANYRAFQQAELVRGVKLQRLAPGRTDQIALRAGRADFPTFRVRNIKSSEELWTPGGVKRLFPRAGVRYSNGSFNENPESLAIKISYGAFDYFTGGDNTGMSGLDDLDGVDVESRMAPSVGPVDVMTFDHHGNRDAMNARLLRTLKPRVLIEQTWVSDQPGGEVVRRLANQAIWPGPRDVFATHLADETRGAIGAIVDRTYTAAGGTVAVRVAPGGGSYRIFMLSDEDAGTKILKSFGPYQSR
ncbi:MBL fold metallo-hydrolase [Phenylobacterium sp.]|uniref:ComEC/Rec2 family competence protein n=1 Tax=Phenylobacterium sp. TaxID=1871053 RepID=UPI0025F23A85|nr:MBL fold metallo-hydrolase [Phenylobacterium sp.]